jgi:hypothetical protein
VVQGQVGGFSSLHFWSRLPLRNSFACGYTRGFNRTYANDLGLEGEEGVRGFDSPLTRGDQRLRAGVETVAFLPPSLLGFKFATFGFADAGYIAPAEAALFKEPLYASLGAGVRIKNPGLVFPTLQIRLARVREADDWHTELAVQTNGDSFFDFLVPGVEPMTLPYR